MGLSADLLQADIQAALEAALASEFSAEAGVNGAAKDAHTRMAKAISAIAGPIINTILANAVVEGMSASGGPVKGKIT